MFSGIAGDWWVLCPPHSGQQTNAFGPQTLQLLTLRPCSLVSSSRFLMAPTHSSHLWRLSWSGGRLRRVLRREVFGLFARFVVVERFLPSNCRWAGLSTRQVTSSRKWENRTLSWRNWARPVQSSDSYNATSDVQTRSQLKHKLNLKQKNKQILEKRN